MVRGRAAFFSVLVVSVLIGLLTPMPTATAIPTPTPTPTTTPTATPAATKAAAAAPATPTATPAATKAAAAAPTTTVSATIAAPIAASPAASAAAPVTAAPAVTTTPSAGAATGSTTGILTTKEQSGGPTIIVDGSGDPVTFRGIGIYGFNIGLTATGNLSAGPDAVSNDFEQIVYRMRMLGFNSVRLPFAFDSVWGLGQPPISYTAACDVPSPTAIERTLTPTSAAQTTRTTSKNTLPPLAPPAVPNGICNAALPNDSTYNRFLWVVNYFISQGFYVMLDFHSNRYGDSLGAGNESLYDQPSWIASWVQLVQSVLKNTPAAAGKLLIDLINEPDGYSLTWETQGKVPSLGSYYINTITALYAVCPGCLFLIEGGGQDEYCGINWGNGFITDENLISSYSISDPNSFFTSLLSQPWLKQVVLAPHFYCPEVSGATACFSGSSLYDALDVSVGYLTVSPGYCANSTCRVFPIILDEFGSTFDNADEISCMTSIMDYTSGAANTKTHAAINSWFYWAWQPDSAGTGGLVGNNWKDIVWTKIGYLTGGTKNYTTGFSLSPWYLSAFTDLTPVSTNFPTSIAIAPKAAVPVAAPAAGPLPSNLSAGSATPTPTIPAGFINGNNTVSSPGAPQSNLQSLVAQSGTTTLSKGGLSNGAIAGIVVGAVVGVAAFIGLAVLVAARMKNRAATVTA